MPLFPVLSLTQQLLGRFTGVCHQVREEITLVQFSYGPEHMGILTKEQGK